MTGATEPTRLSCRVQPERRYAGNEGAGATALQVERVARQLVETFTFRMGGNAERARVAWELLREPERELARRDARTVLQSIEQPVSVPPGIYAPKLPQIITSVDVRYAGWAIGDLRARRAQMVQDLHDQSERVRTFCEALERTTDELGSLDRLIASRLTSGQRSLAKQSLPVELEVEQTIDGTVRVYVEL